MTDRRLTARLVSGLLVLALLAAACGDDSESATTTEATAVPTPAESSTTTTALTADSPEGAAGEAAGLRADLTNLLQEHVYLGGFAVEQVVDEGGDAEAPGAQDAVATLAQNSEDLSTAVGSLYGVAAGEQFLELWQAHIDSYLEYVAAQVAGDGAAAEAAGDDLAGHRDELGDFFEEQNELLTADAVADELEPHVETFLAAADAFVATDPAAWSALREAGQVMPGIALVLAEAIVEQQGIDGSVTSPGADLRADLTGLLQEHVYLTGATIAQTLEGGGADSPDAAAARAALDENAQAMSQVFADVYGDAAGEDFLELWQPHSDQFVDYAVARAAGDADGMEQALAGLHDFREELGAFLETLNDTLTAEAVAAELQPYVDSLQVAVDAMVDDEGDQVALLREAAQVMPLIARTLATNLQLDL